MSLHTLSQSQFIPVSIEEAWEFFSSPVNLDLITPPDMRFVILSDFKKGDHVFPGMLIHYKVSPLFNIPLSWTTEITQVMHLSFFIDEQRKGPFAYWRHEHQFKQVDGGIEMSDTVQWEVPGWIFGDLINNLIVRSRVEEIFAFRKRKIEKLFPDPSNAR